MTVCPLKTISTCSAICWMQHELWQKTKVPKLSIFAMHHGDRR